MIECCMRTCMGTQRWAPWWIPAALGALYDISGAPRCPLAVVEATAALAWRRTEGWGPSQLADEQRACWEAAVGWAGAPRAALALPGPTSDLRRERAVLVEASERTADLRELRLQAHMARSLYRGLWAARWERRAERGFWGDPRGAGGSLRVAKSGACSRRSGPTGRPSTSFVLCAGASGGLLGPAPQMTAQGTLGAALLASDRGSGGPGAPPARRPLALPSALNAWGLGRGWAVGSLRHCLCLALVAALWAWRSGPPLLC